MRLARLTKVLLVSLCLPMAACLHGETVEGGPGAAAMEPHSCTEFLRPVGGALYVDYLGTIIDFRSTSFFPSVVGGTVKYVFVGDNGYFLEIGLSGTSQPETCPVTAALGPDSRGYMWLEDNHGVKLAVSEFGGGASGGELVFESLSTNELALEVSLTCNNCFLGSVDRSNPNLSAKVSGSVHGKR